MEKSCKCFGYSGTCTYSACWLVLPSSFGKVGASLKERFDSASKVSYGNKGKKFHVEKLMKAPTSEDLVYSTDSPTFCEKDTKIGSFGTTGRYCNATSIGIDGCELMCCNRGSVTRVEKKQTYCKCTFIWCCVVKCKICPQVTTVNTCLWQTSGLLITLGELGEWKLLRSRNMAALKDGKKYRWMWKMARRRWVVICEDKT